MDGAKKDGDAKAQRAGSRKSHKPTGDLAGQPKIGEVVTFCSVGCSMRHSTTSPERQDTTTMMAVWGENLFLTASRHSIAPGDATLSCSLARQLKILSPTALYKLSFLCYTAKDLHKDVELAHPPSHCRPQHEAVSTGTSTCVCGTSSAQSAPPK